MSEVLRRLIKHINTSFGNITIDSKISVLHYRITTSLLLLCCALVSSQQYFGKPLQCVQSGSEATVAENVLNTFCFITSTYTLISVEGENNHGVVQENKIRKHAYYQWVPSVLFLQALLFVIPHTLWRYIDNGLMEGCVNPINDQLIDLKKLNNNLVSLAKYLSLRLHTFQGWGIWYFINEGLNSFNVCFNFVITDVLLGGNFRSYGVQVFHYFNGEENVSPFDTIFPKLTKCDFYKYGPSGNIQKHDALCLMTLNIVNEKIFTILWVWFFLLGITSCIALLFHIGKFTIITFKPRSNLLRRCYPLDKITLENSALIEKLSVSDWIFLEQIRTNLDKPLYNMLTLILSSEIVCSNETTYNNSNRNITI